MAVETFGHWGEDAEVLLDAMAEHTHYFKQVLAVTLQRAVHRTVTHTPPQCAVLLQLGSRPRRSAGQRNPSCNGQFRALFFPELFPFIGVLFVAARCKHSIAYSAI